MRFSLKKYKDKLIGAVILDDPQYLYWMKNKGSFGGHPDFELARRMINNFDALPLTAAKCSGNCGKTPTRLSLYNDKFNGEYWWCDSCDPYLLAARGGVLSTVRNYIEYYNDKQAGDIANAFAKAKGLSGGRTEKKLKSFFGV